ncbi:hypothetical protein MXB_5367 [Myxobolus squamalis]|nr:hypothetical protein MXB_5367 [Myxobolus squamalis]
MGLIVGICAPLACCFTQTACKLCCTSCPGCRYSTATRIGYSVFMAVVAFCSYICTTEFLAKLLVKVQPLCNYYNTSTCEAIVGYEAVYRVHLSTAIFFLFMCLVMVNVRTSRDIRAFFHFSCYVLIIDFAHSWNESWLEHAEDDRSWLGGLLTAVLLMSILSVSGIVCMYVYLARSSEDNCSTQKFVISFHLIFSCILYIVSVLSKVREARPTSGLLQSSCIFLYTTFIVFSALALEEGTCNRILSSTQPNNAFKQFAGIFSLAFTVAMLLYSSFHNSENSHLLGLAGNDNYNAVEVGEGNTGEYGQHIEDDEEDGVAYNYSLFHFFMLLATLYLMMIITNWYNPAYPETRSSSKAAVWVKITSAWMCQAIYLWTLLAPIIIEDRDFI